MSPSSNGKPKLPIVWVDCEMTGLSITHDALIEVAVIVTDGELNRLDDGIDLVVKPPRAALDGMNDFVRDMHTHSGLLDVLNEGITLAEAQAACLEYVKQWVPDAGKAPLAGNSVGTDRLFIARDLPEFEAHLSYRTIDVSSLKELAKRWLPRIFFNSPTKHGGHRAHADIVESIQELKYYREAMLVPEPGPSSAEAKALGRKYEVRPDEAAPQVPNGENFSSWRPDPPKEKP
ncbi:oligoribonuclease [Micrococcales bacterium 31B]|nr:oligoribonuclease [Micrococcales bacterium 31B]